MRLLRTCGFIALLACACAHPLRKPSTPEGPPSLIRQLNGPAELRGVYGGLGKDGPYALVDGEPISLRSFEPELGGVEKIGAPIVVRGVLRHTGPTSTGYSDPDDPVQAAVEGFYMDEATVEFPDEPPPSLESRVGQWVIVQGLEAAGEPTPQVRTDVGSVCFVFTYPGHDVVEGRRVLVSGILERGDLPCGFLIRDPNIRAVRQMP